MAFRTTLDPNSTTTNAYYAAVNPAGYIPTEDSRPVLPHLTSTPSTEGLPSSSSLESMPVYIPSVYATPSLPALPSSSSLESMPVYIPSVYATPSLPALPSSSSLESMPVYIPSVPASPSLPTLSSNGSLPTQPSLVELAITKVLRNRCIFFGIGHDKQFEFLSDHYPCSFEFGGKPYLCVTAAYQAQKFGQNSELEGKFTTLNAEEASFLWGEHREDTAVETVGFLTELKIHQAKFKQNPELQKLLLLTADAYLACCNFWIGEDGSGQSQNRSGKILMQIRKELGGIGAVERPANFEALLKELNASHS